VLLERTGKADGGSYASSAVYLLSWTDKDSCMRVLRAVGRDH
jgi:hypothetical protein